jgi:hypothetical protein
VLNNLLDVPYHHLIMAIPWSRRGGTHRHHDEPKSRTQPYYPSRH